MKCFSVSKLIIYFISYLFIHIQLTVATPSIQAGFSPEGCALELVLNTINSANRNIRLMSYSFTSPEVIKALLSAKKRGVDVKIVLDKKGSQNKLSPETIKNIINSGIQLRTNNKYAIMHDKVIIVDDCTIEVGSLNYTKAGLRKNSENVLVIRNIPELVSLYISHWQSRWDSGSEWSFSH